MASLPPVLQATQDEWRSRHGRGRDGTPASRRTPPRAPGRPGRGSSHAKVNLMEQIEGYTVVYRQAEDIILAEVPAIPGCFSDGKTLDEARQRVRDAILSFLDDLKESGEGTPSDVLEVERLRVGMM